MNQKSPQMALRPNHYSPAEEIAHSVTHGVGLLLSIVGLVVLVVFVWLGSQPVMFATLKTLKLFIIIFTIIRAFVNSRQRKRMILWLVSRRRMILVLVWFH